MTKGYQKTELIGQWWLIIVIRRIYDDQPVCWDWANLPVVIDNCDKTDLRWSTFVLQNIHSRTKRQVKCLAFSHVSFFPYYRYAKNKKESITIALYTFRYFISTAFNNAFMPLNGRYNLYNNSLRSLSYYNI